MESLFLSAKLVNFNIYLSFGPQYNVQKYNITSCSAQSKRHLFNPLTLQGTVCGVPILLPQ